MNALALAKKSAGVFFSRYVFLSMVGNWFWGCKKSLAIVIARSSVRLGKIGDEGFYCFADDLNN